ncbi:uncharacterized protein [Littorina saxatilis]|uniref:uncharacterized protein n=1 Tax=Littorina saxatilis TaxID=31220 RepID=UPI0038B58A6D
MDEATFTQQLQAAFVEDQEDDAQKLIVEDQEDDAQQLIKSKTHARNLIKTYAQQFPAATGKLLGEVFSKQMVSFGWVNSVLADRASEFRSVKEAFLAQLARCNHWDFLQIVWNSNWRTRLLMHFHENKDDVGLFLRNLSERRKVTEINLFLADSLHNALFTEVVCVLGDPETHPSSVWTDTNSLVYDRVYKSIVNSFNEDKLDSAFYAVGVDERYACQYLKTLLAARLRKWRQVTMAVSRGRVVLLKGADEVFVRAMQCRAWSCAAHVLNAVMLEKDVNETEFLLDIQYKAEVRLMGKLRYSAILIPFVQQCRRLKLYAAGALFAAWDRKWKVVENLLDHLQQGSGDNANLVLLEELLKNRKFRLVYNWLQRPTQHKLWPKYVDSILWETIVNCKNPEAHALAEQLMDRCEDGSLISQVLYHIILYCQRDLLHKFLAKDLLRRTEDLDFALHCAVDMFGSTVALGDAFPELPRYQVVLKCLEAGCSARLSQSAKLPLDVAVRHGLVPVIQLFYQTGAYGNSVFHRIHAELTNGSGDNSPKRNAAEVEECLQQLVDTPRSLLSACCVTVSRLMGSCADRKERALGLGLPILITRKVLFLDILYPDSRP